MHGDRNTGICLLALLYAVCGGLCALAAARPPDPATPVGLLTVLALVGLAGGGLIWVTRDRVREPMVHVALAVVSGLVALLAWQAATAAGVVGLGPCVVAVGVFAGHFFDRPTARAHAWTAITLVTAGVAAAAPSGTVRPWIPTVVAVLVLTEVQACLSAKLRLAADTDPLTGLANRRAWETATTRNLAHAARTGEPLTIAVLDLDRFKEVNDESGHSAGDALLRTLARAWSAELRSADLLGRLGGDEFVLCLPDTDDDATADLIARLRASHPAPWSVGTATARPGEDLLDLLARADAELYERKRARAS